VLSSAAALLDGHFEHPAKVFALVPDVQAIEVLLCRNGFP